MDNLRNYLTNTEDASRNIIDKLSSEFYGCDYDNSYTASIQHKIYRYAWQGEVFFNLLNLGIYGGLKRLL